MTALTVTVSPASLADKAVISGLFQFYAYDFSELEPLQSDRFLFGADGLFSGYPHLDAYWSEAGREPLMVHCDGKVAGFVLLNDHSHNGSKIDVGIAEFFVARQYRRGGTGSRVLQLITATRPGRWEAAIAQQNTPALAFWPKALAALPGVRDITTVQGDGVEWRGPIMHFKIG